jgi:hypothetical protein
MRIPGADSSAGDPLGESGKARHIGRSLVAGRLSRVRENRPIDRVL